jgi:dual-specificity kinase
MFSFFSKCIHLLNWFDYRNHICLVSELLGMCVYDFLKENDFTPFPRDHIQSFAQQLLGSVACTCFTHLSTYQLLISYTSPSLA